MSAVASSAAAAIRSRSHRATLLIAPAVALLYPFLLMAFHECVGTSPWAMAWAMAACALGLAFAVPMIALAMAARFAAVERPTTAELLARRAALFAVAAPPIYTFLGVVTYLLGVSEFDIWAFALLWLALALALLFADNETLSAVPSTPARASARVAHGVIAVALLLLFLAGHVANHLVGLIGGETHIAVMKVLRHIYRQPLIEPLLIAGFLFMAISGSYLAWRMTARATEGMRTFQVASGVFLMVFVVGHINSVLVLARRYLNIDSDWGFATGAPAGLIHDAWNIRLVPHYGLGVFFVLAHLAAGTRSVLLAHRCSRAFADGVQTWGTALAALVALVIICGLCGLRLSWA